MSSKRSHVLALLFLLVLIDVSIGWVLPQKSLLSDHRPSLNHNQNAVLARRQASDTQTSPLVLCSSKFSQPAFSQPAFSGNNDGNTANKKSQQQQRRKDPVVRKFGADSKIASLHSQRVKTAGRVGTKRYVDPCKVFFGNLPFTTTEKVLETWIAERMGMPASLLLSQVKVIRDWKTGKSKGYGFAVFTEAIHGTVCIDKCNNQLLDGRALSVNQGKKKESTQIYIKKEKQLPADADEEMILAGMKEASMAARMDPQEAILLRKLDPDLVDDDFDQDIGLFDENDMEDDEEDGVDGFYVEDVEEYEDDNDATGDEGPMNRKKRREVARQRKRRKPANKGFG